MDCKGTSLVKKEKNEIYAEPESLFLEGPLKIVTPSLRIKQDLELKQEDGIEHDCLEDNLVISHPNDFIKEDPELNLEVAASIRNASDSLSFIQSAGDSCDISYQETLHQGVVNDKLEKDAEKSTDFSVSHNCTKVQTSQEDGLCGTRLSCSIREKELHKFNCSFCLQSFPSKYRLIMHIFIHIDGVQAPAFVCKSCGEVLPTDDCLKEHLRVREVDQTLSATNSEKLECSDDHENNISFECVQEGIVEQTEEPPSYKVPRKTFKKSVNDICNTHTVKEAEEKLERCNDCGILCASDHVHVHTVLSAKGHHKCDDCGKMFTQLCNLKKHTGERSHECVVRRKSFTERGSLKRHELIHTGQKPHKCDVCGKSFTQSSQLKTNMLIHTGQRSHKCGVCAKSFTRSASLKTHVLIHTGERPYKCDTCGKLFNALSNLKAHKLIHSGKRPYKCSICGKSFTHWSSCRRHEFIHTGQRPHKCDVCGKSFTQSGHLKNHSLIHTGKRPHKCDVCAKSFSERGSLKKHELIHTGQSPHKCDVCGKSFTQSSHLKTHMLIHTGKRSHKCGVCAKSFTRSASLKTHVLIHT
ncbi:zinc finger protein 99-like isoform X2 [Schistocerca cancellata]|uniref:zinc finger protein 99-like isoform X1 n=1 Tax=Schistocerca cancellata TaxID=274614 RepID=UPI0021174067|nr:zinc finger protein 99-like isoform X1 [Schistocerca cancellata]XP_049770057.1 zinc finger protein 99-like isoform X1 [Schistocerca cancellata]XP_049770058.1 zinc finger protein 99-like isoform X2 [Schistocerca cancellata]